MPEAKAAPFSKTPSLGPALSRPLPSPFHQPIKPGGGFIHVGITVNTAFELTATP